MFLVFNTTSHGRDHRDLDVRSKMQQKETFIKGVLYFQWLSLNVKSSIHFKTLKKCQSCCVGDVQTPHTTRIVLHRSCLQEIQPSTSLPHTFLTEKKHQTRPSLFYIFPQIFHKQIHFNLKQICIRDAELLGVGKAVVCVHTKE